MVSPSLNENTAFASTSAADAGELTSSSSLSARISVAAEVAADAEIKAKG